MATKKSQRAPLPCGPSPAWSPPAHTAARMLRPSHEPAHQGATGPKKMAGLPRSRARACWVAPHESNVKVFQSTRALLKMPGRPGQGFPEHRGRACGAMPGLSYPAAHAGGCERWSVIQSESASNSHRPRPMTACQLRQWAHSIPACQPQWPRCQSV